MAIVALVVVTRWASCPQALMKPWRQGERLTQAAGCARRLVVAPAAARAKPTRASAVGSGT